MVTVIKKLTGGAYPFYEYACLSTDIKPVSLVPDNSICHEIDTGKHFYCVNGAWHELPPRGGSEGGGGLPEPVRSGNIMQVSAGTGVWEQVYFPLADEDNDGKLIGIKGRDGVYRYTAVPAPSGGAEKFIVTLTQENNTWTADKTIAEIVAANEANQVVVCKYTDNGVLYELALVMVYADPEGTSNVCGFSSVWDMVGQTKETRYAIGQQDESDVWAVGTNSIPTSTTEPLIVTLTAGQTEGQFVGDKTYKEVYDAFIAGQNCILNIPDAFVAVAVLSVGHETGYTISASNEISAAGSANDYITVTAGG